jgi:quercetin dioxygenase-like cupin family protein
MPGIEGIDLHLQDGNDRTCVWETDNVQIMRIRLAPGETLPRHNSNSHVVLLPLAGKLKLETPGQTEVFGTAEALSVPFDTQMDVSNAGEEPATFLVIKTPHPKKMR